MAVENLPEINARDFGIRIAKVFKEVASSNVFFFVQRAYENVGGVEELEWGGVVELLNRLIAEEGQKTERELTVEYIKENFGDTEVGKQILMAFEPLSLSPLPPMPWEGKAKDSKDKDGMIKV